MDCLSIVSREFISALGFHVFSLSILFRAMQKGVFLLLSKFIDSSVCYSRPCMMSTTRTAISQRLEPRDLRFVNDSWPGVSITKNPGISKSIGSRSWMLFKCFCKFSYGKYVAPICCVIPPASFACTFVFLSLSRINVLPVSTWPIIQIIGHLSCFFLSAPPFLAFAAYFLRSARALRYFSRLSIAA